MSKYEKIDKFGIDKLSPADYKKKYDYVTKNCKCSGCPTYVAGDAPVGYCFPTIGTSKAIHWEKDCVCSTCPVYKEYELSHSFYCTRCSQFCQAVSTDMAGGQGGSG